LTQKEQGDQVHKAFKSCRHSRHSLSKADIKYDNSANLPLDYARHIPPDKQIKLLI
jgi:hypothetical protein